MLISCENCNKKFEVSEDLIPDQGRLLQCSSCDYKWFFKNVIKDHKASKIKPIFKENKDEISSFEPSQDLSNVKKQHTIESEDEIQIPKQKPVAPIKKGKQLNYFKILIVFIISIIALIVLLDTFKYQINSAFPSTETILFNLYESLTDIKLFIRDLIK